MQFKRFFDKDVIKGLCYGLLAGAAVLAVILPLRMGAAPATTPHALQPARQSLHRELDFAGEAATPDARRLAQWIVARADNGTRPFVILDKKDARVFVFAAGGRLLGASPVLLGYAVGDDTVPGIGSRPIEAVRPEERTTPAGRFVSLAGRNTLGEDVLWVDYDAAVSMHRVRLVNAAERRAERLASPTAADNRISYGCINLPVPFFEQVLWPNLRGGQGVVYVMPETKPLEQAFPTLASSLPAAG
jgi:hypothetical protein